jgi:hypothetical protein
MKISKEYLKQIIKEELEKTIIENNERDQFRAAAEQKTNSAPLLPQVEKLMSLKQKLKSSSDAKWAAANFEKVEEASETNELKTCPECQGFGIPGISEQQDPIKSSSRVGTLLGYKVCKYCEGKGLVPKQEQYTGFQHIDAGDSGWDYRNAVNTSKSVKPRGSWPTSTNYVGYKDYALPSGEARPMLDPMYLDPSKRDPRY